MTRRPRRHGCGLARSGTATRPPRFESSPWVLRWGARWRAFRGDLAPADSQWAEDWVASCITASHPDPEGRAQGLSVVGPYPGTPLAERIRRDPRGWLGAVHRLTPPRPSRSSLWRRVIACRSIRIRIWRLLRSITAHFTVRPRLGSSSRRTPRMVVQPTAASAFARAFLQRISSSPFKTRTWWPCLTRSTTTRCRPGCHLRPPGRSALH